MRVSSFWFKDAREDKQKDEISRDLLNARAAFARLRELLEDEINSTMRGVRSEKNYEGNPNWDRWVADQFGYARALEKMIERIPNYEMHKE